MQGRSAAYLHHLQKHGLEPETVIVGSGTKRVRRLITPQQHRDWLARLDKIGHEQARGE
jgi:hypothetical protein